MVIIAIWSAGYRKLAGFINGCLIFSVLSSSNTSLYVSSRTLYGLVREMPGTNWINMKLKVLSLVERHTAVPTVALFVSAVSFFWLPFLQLKGGYSIQNVSGSIKPRHENTDQGAAD